MRYYSDREPIPAAVITLATQEDNKQHILFQTRYDVEGYYTVTGQNGESVQEEINPCPNTLEWAIKALSVSLFRDWSTCQARITLACNIPYANAPLPRLPRVDKFRGGQYPFLTVEDEIRIYAGYVSSPNEPISADMLDEVPFPQTEIAFQRDDGGQTRRVIQNAPGMTQPNLQSGKLVPIFWGFIDKIDFDGNAKGSGYQVILSCRDRTRVLTDTTLVAIPSLNGVFGTQGSAATPQGRLSSIISDVARAVNGYQINIADRKQDNLNCWKTIITPTQSLNEEGLDRDRREANEDIRNAARLCEYYSAWDESNGTSRKSTSLSPITSNPAYFVRRASFKVMDPLSRPRFHMWLSRPPLAKNNKKAQWQVLNQTPLKIIKWVAAKEERAMDFFASHVNGDFCLVPRALDVSGFEDEVRMYRTYFFRDYPRVRKDGQVVDPPCKNQLILGLRSFTSTVGTYNRFTIVDNSNVAGSGLAVLEGVKLTIDRLPFILDGGPDRDEPNNAELDTTRRPSPPCKQKLIFDGSLGTYGNSFGGALIVAQSVSAQLARDASGVEFTVLGDPTFYPGEAVRIWNTFLHDLSYQTQTGDFADILAKESAIDRFNAKWYNTQPQVENGPDAVLTNEGLSDVVKDVQSTGTQATATDGDNLKLPVYKIRDIEHRIKTTGRNAGYTTVISAVMDLNN